MNLNSQQYEEQVKKYEQYIENLFDWKGVTEDAKKYSGEEYNGCYLGSVSSLIPSGRQFFVNTSQVQNEDEKCLVCHAKNIPFRSHNSCKECAGTGNRYWLDECFEEALVKVLEEKNLYICTGEDDAAEVFARFID